MSDDYGLLDKDGDAAPTCPACEWDLEWKDCPACGGEGFFDWETLQDEDPMWFQPGDVEKCMECDGLGGWHYCPNPQCERVIV